MSGSPTFRASSPAAATSADTRAVSGGWGGMMYHSFIAAAPHALWARTACRTVASSAM